MSNQGFRKVRYPDFPRTPLYLMNSNVTEIQDAWQDMGRWVGSFIRVLEDADAKSIQNIIFDANKSIDVFGRIKVGDTDPAVSVQAGDIRYNSSTNKHQGYNGSGWNDMY